MRSIIRGSRLNEILYFGISIWDVEVEKFLYHRIKSPIAIVQISDYKFEIEIPKLEIKWRVH
jgi:hypothetical protein